jgi:two-component system cell cycle response regulator
MPARILLIEDNPANLELMSYVLQAFGYVVRSATDGGLGLKVAYSEPFDLIVCDIQLPVADGFEVIRQLKAHPELSKTPVVAITALAMVGDRERVLNSGFDGYIAKPIDAELFVHQIESYLRPDRRQNFVPPTLTTSHVASPRPPTHRTILVVDNLGSNLDLARSILEPHGYRVLTAPGMQEGLAIARQNKCDLILSDVCMLGGSGFDFIRVVKSDPLLAGIPFLFITSTNLEERDRQLGLSLGAARFLYRPIEPDALLAEIDACLSEAAKVV